MKKASIFLSALLMSVVLVISCRENSSNESATPNEVIIGKQLWMGKNLNVDKFRNGEIIPEAKTKEEWEKAGENEQPAWCYYNNDNTNGEKYGKLYNWFAVNDPRGLAPKGWKIPSYEDWKKLIDYLGGTDIAGFKMKSVNGWSENGNGSNESGFSGLPSGSRMEMDDFKFDGKSGNWWSSTQGGTFTDGLEGALSYSAIGLTLDPEEYVIFGDWSGYYKVNGLSVRCVRD